MFSPVACAVVSGLSAVLATKWNSIREDRLGPGKQAVRHCREECVRNENECVLNQENVKMVGFLGLVGKEPDVARGLLIDTGASINVHGINWFWEGEPIPPLSGPSAHLSQGKRELGGHPSKRKQTAWRKAISTSGSLQQYS